VNFQPSKETIMTTTITEHGNGTATQRKTLASQLDRLDSILDALDIGLKEAVATAVQGAVEQAVREAVTQAVQQAVEGLVSEVLSNPDILAVVRATLAPPPSAVPVPAPPAPTPEPGRRAGWGARLWKRVSQACSAVHQGATRVASAVKEGLRLVKPYRKPLLVAAGVGTAVAVGACLVGPWLAGPAAWVGGFLGSLAVRAGAAVRSSLGLAPTVT
jgi:hypothetical protein